MTPQSTTPPPPPPQAQLQQPPQPQLIDDKSPHCIPFILSRLAIHRAQHPDKPFFVGLNGVQGAGKTTLVSVLRETLQGKGLETLVCSIDDLYLTHENQARLAEEHRDNALVQHRGEPGVSLSRLRSFLPSLLSTLPKPRVRSRTERKQTANQHPNQEPTT